MTKHYKPSICRRLSRLLPAVPGLLLWASGTVALADDTEILTGQIGDFEAPNILFVIDTSGSMDGQVLIDESYDAAVDYDGPFDATPGRIYYTLTDFGGGFNYPDESSIALGQFVQSSSFVCDAATNPLAESGFYVDRFAQYNPLLGEWSFLRDDDANPDVSGVNRFTECFRDLGVHGTGNPADGTFPANGQFDISGGGGEVGTVPFTDDENDPDRFDWASYQLTYAFFDNNYLNWIASRAAAGDPVLSTRLGVVQQVTRELIDRLTVVDDPRQAFNIGLMRFSTNAQGGMVLAPVASVASSRDTIVQAIESMTPSNNTPLSETLYEAYQYYRGGAVDFGLASTPQPSVGSSNNGSNYISPITASCQKNYIVLLTDGLPTSDDDARDRIEAITGTACGGNCLDDMAIHMDQNDILPGLEDEQTVQTFTIGFFTDSTLLQNAATGTVPSPVDGEPPLPGYFLADNVAELQNAFNAIFSLIETDVATFTAPATSVNSINRLQNRDILYFAMFEPSGQGEPRWNGNLKAYRVGRESDGGDLTLLDAEGNEAISPDGIFTETARSIWSAGQDGGSITDGGFASRLSITRRVFTDVNGPLVTAPNNRVSENNIAITADQLGLATPPGPDGPALREERRKLLLRMASGLTEDGEARRTIGDPLHTRPLILTFPGDDGNDLSLFLTTNDGFLHRIDPTVPASDLSSDLEEWAYIPKELLPNLDLIERNPPTLPSATQKLYGLDGPLTVFVEGDTNNVVDPDERVILYAAMRRGGTGYYALDLGLGGRRDPRRAWRIGRGGEFSRLGQSWSAAEPARMNINGTEKDVIIFGGGYDPAHDNDGGYVPSNMGSAIYIVDAITGEQLFRASSEDSADLTLPDMVYPIPSDITVLDMNRDGLADRLYVGDMGGQVWRLDNIDGQISGTVLARLGSDATPGDERRFYNAPSVARVLTRNGSYLAVAIGSGWRAHPLATENNDRFYVLKDLNVFTPQIDESGNVVYPPPLTNADLVGLTLGQPADSSALAGAGGWYLPLASGEKNLARALIADNRVFFTTYLPDGNPPTCQPSAAIGSGRLYALNLFTGLPALVNADGSDGNYEVFETGGIPPEVQLVFVEPPCTANCDVLTDNDPDNDDQAQYSTLDGSCLNPGSEVRAQVGLNGIPIDICTAPVPTYWSEAEDEWGAL